MTKFLWYVAATAGLITLALHAPEWFPNICWGSFWLGAGSVVALSAIGTVSILMFEIDQ